MRVDESVLAVGEDGTSDRPSIIVSRGGGPTLAGKTPRTWVRGTTENVQDAHHWLADSARCERRKEQSGEGRDYDCRKTSKCSIPKLRVTACSECQRA